MIYPSRNHSQTVQNTSKRGIAGSAVVDVVFIWDAWLITLRYDKTIGVTVMAD
jgi:hypothetical protein